MPPVTPYRPDQVQTRPLAGTKQGPAPTPEVFGAQFGQTLQRVGDAVLDEAARIRAEERRLADQRAVITAERQYNNLNRTMLLAEDRGPEGLYMPKGVLTMTGKEPHDQLENALTLWDQQSDEIVKAARNPEQQLALERMRDQQRARFIDTATRHAQTELAKYDQGETNALLKSSVETIGALAGTENAPALIAEQLARQADIIERWGDKIGLYSPEAKELARRQLRSDSHVLAINKLIEQKQDIKAQEYFDEVTQHTDLYPEGQILESQLRGLREKLRINSSEQAGYRNADLIWMKLGPKANDFESPVLLDEMSAMARDLAKGNPDIYEKTRGYLQQRAADTEVTRRNRQSSISDKLWTGFWGPPRVSLDQLRLLPEWNDADGVLRTQITNAYVDRDRQAVSDARAARAEVRAEAGHQVTMRNAADQLKEWNGWGLFYDLSDPKVLSQLSRGEILRHSPNLSERQVQALLAKKESIDANLAGGATTVIDREMFKQRAFNAGITYAFTPTNQEERNRMGLLEGEVTARVNAAEVAGASATGVRRKLDPAAQAEVIDQVLAERVTIPGFLGFFGRDLPASMVTQDEAGKAIVKWPDIPPTFKDRMRTFILNEPVKAGVTPTRRLREPEVDNLFQTAMERAYADALVNGGETWQQVLRDAIANRTSGNQR